MTSQLDHALVLIDGDNLLFSLKHLNITLDFAKLRDALLHRFGSATRLNYYSSINPSVARQKEFLATLTELGYHLHIEKGKTSKSFSDIQMMVDAMSLSADYDTIVLLSGDSEFSILLTKLRSEGKHTVVISIPIVTSQALKISANEWLNLEHFLSSSALPIKDSSELRVNPPTVTPQVESYYLEKGIRFKSYVRIRSILQAAKHSVTIIDGYINEEILYLLAILSKKVKCRIITRKVTGRDFEVMLAKLRKEGRAVEICKSDIFHDRFIRVDEGWWHLGHSIKDLGSADAVLSKVGEPSVAEKLHKREDEVLKSCNAP